ncbi:MAG: hypothetical protein Q7T96_18405 [Methylobacter sp.]|nr:hypothetical protein [Methylobacter sp.]
MNSTAIDKLTAYHSGHKVKVGIAYIAKPPEPAPQPVKPDPTTVALTQVAEAYFGLSRIYKNLGD